jgi:hypothetical protein
MSFTGFYSKLGRALQTVAFAVGLSVFLSRDKNDRKPFLTAGTHHSRFSPYFSYRMRLKGVS